MPMPQSTLRTAAIVAVSFAWISCSDRSALSQPPKVQTPATSATAIDSTDANTDSMTSESLRFSFDRMPWRDVIRWLADECDLALQFDDLPPGSFTYSDPAKFTRNEAIDRVNLFLLPQGYSLVRSGRLMSVINLSDPRSLQQLDSIAPLIQADDLETQSDYDVVKCLFRLQELDADEATDELQPLKLMTEPSVFPRTNQLMIIDTVAKLKNVKAILDSFTPDALENGTVMKNFTLQHVEAEDILSVARPHLGLATDEMIGIDVSISADLQGKNIFVTGVEDKVKLIEGLIQSLDIVAESSNGSTADAVFQVHEVEGGNVEMAYNVLLTLLAGESLRLSMDEDAGTVIALASPDVQAEIAKTVEGLQASDSKFSVIPLKTVDPIFAISLIEQMLDLSTFDDDDDDGIPPPKIDADPGNMRLFVRGTPFQIDQIKEIVLELDEGGATDSSDAIRLLPVRGERALSALRSAAKFWRDANPIVLFPSASPSDGRPTERVTSDDEPTTLIAISAEGSASPRVLSNNASSQAPMIHCQITDRGLMLQSEDAAALTKFEGSLQSIIGPADLQASPPIVFYLTHARANDALKMLAELLDGGEAAREGEAGTLVNGYVSSANTYLGSIVMSREGTLTMMAGSMTVVADSRLNRLIAQGTSVEIEKIEDYLRIIDKDTSLTSIQTYGTSRVIELFHTDASEVAATIREAFAGRVAASAATTAQAGGKGQASSREENPRDRDREEGGERAKKPTKKPAASSAVADSEPKMTVTVHAASNSLIVTAPDALFTEVEKLAKSIDQRSETTIEVFTPSNAAIQSILPSVFGGSVAPTSSPSRSRETSSRSSRSSGDSDRSRSIQAFRDKFGR